MSATPRITSDISVTLHAKPNIMTPRRSAATSPTRDTKEPLGDAPVETVKRKRGRPKGWRPGMAYSTGKKNMAREKSFARAERTKGKPAPNYDLKKRRGRPPRRPSPTPQAIFGRVRPKFVSYLCEWQGCRAELHNMATLRKHVMVVHGDSELCKWAKCAAAEPQVRLQDGIDFEEHMERMHLVPFEWHMGDGPQNSMGASKPDHQESELAPYLLDQDGNQVTPSIRDQELEDHITWRNNRRRLRELLMQRDANAPFEEDSPPASEPN